MAIGKVGLGIDPRDISIKIGGYPVASSGKRVAGYDEEIIAEHMAGKLINIKISVGEGSGTSTIWTCDLTHQYISINADYRS